MNVVASTRAAKRYVTPPSKAHILYFGARQKADASHAARWIPLAGGGVDFHPVGGTEVDHYSIMRQPYAGVVAAAIRRAIDEQVWDGESA
jgi:thioesterase domain-containing protein